MSTRKRLLLVAAALLVTTAVAGRWVFFPSPARADDAAPKRLERPEHVGFAVVKTAQVSVREALVFDGGRFGRVLENDFSAFLVKHDATYLLFDAGLGRNVDAQYEADMPRWQRLSFRYDHPVVPARDQLDAAGIGVDRIILSHAHWDHASGVEDFPESDVLATREERDVVNAGGAWRSQVGSPRIKWKTLELDGPPYEGFASSHDVFGDGTLVVVPMFGHTPGSVGLFVKVDSGRRFLFCGDAVWSAGAIKDARPRISLARAIADRDPDEAERVLAHLQKLSSDPSLTIVPAHDGAVQRALGYFPGWVR